jgi:hypothetical protein
VTLKNKGPGFAGCTALVRDLTPNTAPGVLFFGCEPIRHRSPDVSAAAYSKASAAPTG